MLSSTTQNHKHKNISSHFYSESMPSKIGAAHVCFNVENIEELYEDLTNKGIEFVTPPIMTDTENGGRRGICYCQDPEGNWLEFIQAE